MSRYFCVNSSSSAERYFLTVGVVEETAHEIAQLDDHAYGCVVSLFANEAGDGVKCVEEEVRLDLAAKGAELRLYELLVEASSFGLLHGEARTGVEYVPDEDDGAVKDERREKSVVELFGDDLLKGCCAVRFGPWVQEFLEDSAPESKSEVDGHACAKMSQPGGDGF